MPRPANEGRIRRGERQPNPSTVMTEHRRQSSAPAPSHNPDVVRDIVEKHRDATRKTRTIRGRR
jgi:hypothetical protein